MKNYIMVQVATVEREVAVWSESEGEAFKKFEEWYENGMEDDDDIEIHFNDETNESHYILK